jgi:hypothetical protein
MRLKLTLGVLAVLVLAVVGTHAVAADHATRPPKIGEVDYFKQSGEQGAATRLEIYARHADSVKIKASYAADKVTATTSPYKPVSTHRYGSPWIPDHDGGRRALLSLMKDSIAATGAVTLKVIATNHAGTTKTPVSIVWSNCHLEPPLYPFSCTVKP